MSFRMPRAGSAAREALGDIAQIVEALSPARVCELPTLATALRCGRRSFENQPAQTAIFILCLREDTDERWLIRVGPRGGWLRIWNFGTGRD